MVVGRVQGGAGGDAAEGAAPASARVASGDVAAPASSVGMLEEAAASHPLALHPSLVRLLQRQDAAASSQYHRFVLVDRAELAGGRAPFVHFRLAGTNSVRKPVLVPGMHVYMRAMVDGQMVERPYTPMLAFDGTTPVCPPVATEPHEACAGGGDSASVGDATSVSDSQSYSVGGSVAEGAGAATEPARGALARGRSSFFRSLPQDAPGGGGGGGGGGVTETGEGSGQEAEGVQSGDAGHVLDLFIRLYPDGRMSSAL